MTVPAVPPAGAVEASAARWTAAPSTDAATRGGQAFERMLLEQLTTQLAETAAPDGEESPATAAYRDLLPAAMAAAIADAGGIGIAAALDRGSA